jgi:hypothetical protein
MTCYICEKCNKEFNKKCNYKDHLTKKKKPCYLSTISILDNIHNASNLFQNSNVVHKTSENFFEITDVNINNKDDDKNQDELELKLVCDYCDKIFSRYDNLQRHLKTRCKNKKKDDEKDLKIQKMSEEIELLKEIVLKNKDKNFSNNCINNTMNNSHNNTTNIQQNVQVNIAGFGKEDLDKLNILDAMKVYLKSTGGNIIANMLKYINLNENFPENHNICITDMSREIVKMHNGKKYIYKKFKNAKYDIVDKVVDNINGIVNKYKDGEYKKSPDINSKLDINETSLKLISGEELEESEDDSEDEEECGTRNKSSRNTQDIINDLINMDANIQKMIEKKEKEHKNKEKKVNIEHLNSKREGLQQITYDKLKEELYNGK